MHNISGTIILLFGLVGAAWAQQTPVAAAYPKHGLPDRTADAPAASRGDVPDCSGATPVTVTTALDITLHGDTTGLPSLVAAYACEPWDESGPEAVFELQVDQDVLLSVFLDSPLADLDIFLLSDCDSDSCLAAHISQFLAELPARPEPYYLVVDGYRGAAGTFNLTLTAQPGLLDQMACDLATDVACDDVVMGGNVFDQPNLVTMADCGSYLAFGGEDWFRLTLPDRAELDVQVGSVNFDAVLWLFDDCGPDPVCLGYADGGVASEPESISYINESGGELSLLLGVDSIWDISTASGDSEPDGAFSLTVSCSVPVSSEQSTFGDLKSLFR